jgi:phosphopantothenoylcysteine decarboxylase/phosphopantothenate--cysteine ligase
LNRHSKSSNAGDLSGYEVVVAVCGGIAAYKVCEVVSRLVQRGAGVTVAMTDAGTRFVGPATFQALSGRRIITSLWHEHEADDIRHIALSGSADLLLVAPATANMIGKIAGGIADDPVSTLVISAASPIMLAPAMNDRMWKNPLVAKNVETLRSLEYQFVGPGEGWLACRSVGLGRMAEAAEIVEAIVAKLKEKAPRANAK